MSLTAIAATFVLIALAELPDKTMIATLVLGTRYRPFLVWIGASAGLLLQVVIAVAAGRLLELLPHRVLEIIVTAVFAAGAAYLLLVPERHSEESGEHEGEKGAPATDRQAWRVVATTFGIIALGEFGDISQLLIVNLVARYHEPFSVAIGAAVAFVGMAAAGAFGGRALLRYLPLVWIRRAGGVALLGFAAWGVAGLV